MDVQTLMGVLKRMNPEATIKIELSGDFFQHPEDVETLPTMNGVWAKNPVDEAEFVCFMFETEDKE